MDLVLGIIVIFVAVDLIKMVKITLMHF